MDMVHYPLGRCSYEESLKVIEADIQHANALAAAIPRAKDGARFQMKIVYNELAPLVMFLLQWIDSSCTCLLPTYLNLVHVLVYKVHTDGRPKISRHGRKATISDFYGLLLYFYWNLFIYVSSSSIKMEQKVFVGNPTCFYLY
ncbi:hypothetical protein R6Q59_006816 [Mikania micrantha]